MRGIQQGGEPGGATMPGAGPADVGWRLRKARDRRALTIADIAGTTKIPTHVLERIEENRFDTLPGGILTKGHLRAFAGAVGVDPEGIVRQYIVQHLRGACADPPFVLPPFRQRPDRLPRRWLIHVIAIALGALFYYSQARSADPSADTLRAGPAAPSPAGSTTQDRTGAAR